MDQYIYLVFSTPPAGVSDEEYAAFYEQHVGEILSVPGFAAARRYNLGQAAPHREDIRYRHLSVYLLDEVPGEQFADLQRRMAAGELTLPEWFDQILFASFSGRPLEDRTAELPDHWYLVMSHEPRRFSTEAYYGWYYAHARENLTSDGFERVWRFALTPDKVDPDAPSVPTHAALYEVRGDLPELRANLRASFEAGRVDIPEWMSEGDFVSYDCHAASAVKSAPVSARS
jgi:hypothetical protein